jgi:hypothetical protein
MPRSNQRTTSRVRRSNDRFPSRPTARAEKSASNPFVLKWDEFWDALGTAAIVILKSFTYGLACLILSRPASRLGRSVKGGSIAGPITFAAMTLLAARFLSSPFDTIGRVASLLPKSVPTESVVRGFIDSAADAFLLAWMLLFIFVALHVQIARVVGTARRRAERSAWLGYYLAYLVILFTSIGLSTYVEGFVPENAQYLLMVAVLFPVFWAGFWWVWEFKSRTKTLVFRGGLGSIAGAMACILMIAYALLAFLLGMELDSRLARKIDAFNRLQRMAWIAPASVSCTLSYSNGRQMKMMNCRAVAVNTSGAPVLIGGPLTGSLVAQTGWESLTGTGLSDPVIFFDKRPIDVDQNMKVPFQVKPNEVFGISIPSFDSTGLCSRMREDDALKLRSIAFTLAGSLGAQPVHAEDRQFYIHSDIATWSLAFDLRNQILNTCDSMPDRKP